jgi:hypothetical protein
VSFVIAAPETVSWAASDLARIGSMIDAAHAAAVAPTTAVLPAAADEVSAAIAALFSSHAQGFQALGAQAATFHTQFVQLMNAGAGSYASAEAANASPLQAVEQQGVGGDQRAHPGVAGAPADRQRRQRGPGHRG